MNLGKSHAVSFFKVFDVSTVAVLLHVWLLVLHWLFLGCVFCGMMLDQFL